MRVWEQLRQQFLVNDSRNRVLRVDADGVALYDAVRDERLWRFEWQDVRQIVAFKVDAYVIDHICLGFVGAGSDTMWVAYEEMAGWTQLNEELGVASTSTLTIGSAKSRSLRLPKIGPFFGARPNSPLTTCRSLARG
jgi:hypothetical protein